MAAALKDNIDYRLLNGLSNLVICSHCLRNGKVTPIPQVIMHRRLPVNLCVDCRSSSGSGANARESFRVLPFPS